MTGEVAKMVGGDMEFILDGLNSSEQMEFNYISSLIPGSSGSKEGGEAYGNTNDNAVIESIENNTAKENCNMCGIGCGTKLNLKSHMRIKHTKNEMIAIIMSRGGW